MNATPTPKKRLMRRLIRWCVQGALIVIAVFVTLLFALAFASRSKPNLARWHTVVPQNEFSVAKLRPGFDFEQYIKLEDALFAELSDYMLPIANLQGHSRFSRFVQGGPQDPAIRPINWNRTVELKPESTKGGVLLLHGLSDSPYSMRSLAEYFYAQGYFVLVMRMPGHGAVPAGLLEVTWQDWAAAVKLGAQHVQSQIGESNPFYVGGYSNGGALAVRYCLDAIEHSERVPDRLFLFSPAIGITEFARAAWWDALLGNFSYFQKSNWLTVEPEYDPYKYNSFTNNAGTQSWDLAQEIQARMNAVEALGKRDAIPPILTFQSVVDDTVIVETLVKGLYNRLLPNGSEVVFFDLNHTSQLDGFISLDYSDKLQRLIDHRELPFAVTRLTNLQTRSREVRIQTRGANQPELIEEPLGIEWPAGVFSLAHVAIPFPPSDPLYGNEESARDPAAFFFHLGTLAPRGERSVLTIPESQLMRLRHNPFHDYMMRRIADAMRP